MARGRVLVGQYRCTSGHGAALEGRKQVPRIARHEDNLFASLQGFKSGVPALGLVGGVFDPEHGQGEDCVCGEGEATKAGNRMSIRGEKPRLAEELNRTSELL